MYLSSRIVLPLVCLLPQFLMAQQPPGDQYRAVISFQFTELVDGQQTPEKKCDAGVKPCLDLQWDSAGVSPGPISKTGDYKLIIHGLNNVLFTYDFAFTATTAADATANDLFSLAQSAGSLLNGGTTTGTTGGTSTLDKIGSSNECWLGLQTPIQNIQSAFLTFNSALQALNPDPKGSDKPHSVGLQTTISQWSNVRDAYNKLEDPVKALKTAATAHCSAALAAQPPEQDAVDAINKALTQLNQLGALKDEIERLAKAVSADHTQILERHLSRHDTNSVTGTESYNGKQTDHAPVAFQLNTGIPWSSLSAGFLLTELPNPSYSSRTAPNGTTSTNNVLAVDYGSGVRPALVGLFNASLPWECLDSPNWGFAISAGPVYDITGGKADTSRVGFFGGATAHFHRLIYFTAGVHVGEYGAFPIGFTSAGQIIPPNTGTPQATKRYTARAAFAITFSWSKKTGSDSTGAAPKKASGTEGTTSTNTTGSNALLGNRSSPKKNQKVVGDASR